MQLSKNRRTKNGETKNAVYWLGGRAGPGVFGQTLTVPRNGADKRLLTSSLFFEGALVLPPGSEQGHDATMEGNRGGEEP